MHQLIATTFAGLVGCAGLVSGQELACTPLGAAAANADLNALVAAAGTAAQELQTTEAGLQVVTALTVAEAVPEDMQVTVFAPTDTAFQTVLQASTAANGNSLEPQAIAQVILNHIVPGALTSTAIKALLGEAGGSTMVQTLLGSDLYVTTVGDGLYVQSRGILAPGALVVVADTPTCVGPVHVIDSVLLPTDLDGMTVIFESEPADNKTAVPPLEVPSMMAPGSKNCTAVGATAMEAGLTALADTIRAAVEDLTNTPSGMAFVAAVSNLQPLVGDARVTVFAPTNEAFTAAAQKFGGTLPESAVADVLLNHAVPGDFNADNITTVLGAAGGSIVVETLLKSDLRISTTANGLYVQSRGLEAPGALVVDPDVPTCLGSVHVINAVLLPTFPDGAFADFETGEMIDMSDIDSMDGVEEVEESEMVEGDDSAQGAQGVEGARETDLVQTETDGAIASVWGCGLATALAAAVAAF